MKGFALGLALKQRRNATQKSPNTPHPPPIVHKVRWTVMTKRKRAPGYQRFKRKSPRSGNIKSLHKNALLKNIGLESIVIIFFYAQLRQFFFFQGRGRRGSVSIKFIEDWVPVRWRPFFEKWRSGWTSLGFVKEFNSNMTTLVRSLHRTHLPVRVLYSLLLEVRSAWFVMFMDVLQWILSCARVVWYIPLVLQWLTLLFPT